jgi:phosphatidate cytidylyltransferase
MSEPAAARSQSELSLRLASAAVMGTVALVTAWWGSWPFALVWAIASAAVAAEWQSIISADKRDQRTIGGVLAAAFAAFAVFIGNPLLLILTVSAGAAVVWLAQPGLRAQAAIGIAYASVLAAAVLICRSSDWSGAIVIFWLFAAVWGTDTCAYFAGRAIGGPKLWPRVSPKKTWSGAIGGVIGAIVLSYIVLRLFRQNPGLPHIVLSFVFSVATQAGDLFESSLKRRFGVKDAGKLIPGHGGFMDRLDGFIFAVAIAAGIGTFRNGWQNAPTGLLQW